MSDEKFVFQSFLPYKNIIHGVSSQAFGSMKKEDGELDFDHLEAFRKSLRIGEKAVCMKQIHSGTVVVIEDATALRIPDTDGLITNKKQIPLALLTADCLPLLFYDPTKDGIGVAHAGYKGLLNDIIKHTIQKYVSIFKSDPQDIIVGIGPSIERDCYEVGEELVEKFQKKFPSFENIFVERNQKYYLDLRAIALQCLLKEGILKKHIEVMEMCTKDDPNLYSYRGGDSYKRFVSMISLV